MIIPQGLDPEGWVERLELVWRIAYLICPIVSRQIVNLVLKGFDKSRIHKTLVR